MQAVPSLVGTGTAVAAAATGLVFGQLGDGHQLPPSRASSQRKSLPEYDPSNFDNTSRPATRQSIPSPLPIDRLKDSSTQPRTSRPPSSRAQLTSPKSSAPRPISTRKAEPPTIVEDARDSVSSNGSWMRRLSIRPLSQHESIRSSIGPGSPSIFSHGSGAPILGSVPRPSTGQPPNKLVKRCSTSSSGNSGPLERRGSKSQVTLRRPATSHQRSATLQQEQSALPPIPQFIVDEPPRPRAQTVGNPLSALHTIPSEPSTWKSFWHSKVSKVAAGKYSPLRAIDENGTRNPKRICVEQQRTQGVYLVDPTTVMTGHIRPGTPKGQNFATDIDQSPQASEDYSQNPRDTPSRQIRRSISTHLSSPASWISKTGSIRNRKRGGSSTGGDRRQASTSRSSNHGTMGTEKDTSASDTEDGGPSNQVDSENSTTAFRRPDPIRKTSSPIPPPSRLSGVHTDLQGAIKSLDTWQAKSRDRATSVNTGPRSVSATQSRTLERASTVASSEYRRGFTSGDDDDTDFKTDTPFDSFRTAASNQRRATDSPLESMFDESPPSTAGNNSKPKRLSIQEILGPSYEEPSKIMEEDESIQTPMRSAYSSNARFQMMDADNKEDLTMASMAPGFSLGRGSQVSFDDDDDMDWAREDEPHFYNQLSPPSSMNSRRGSPSLRMALANISGNASSFDPQHDLVNGRPRSNIFDWVEPTHHEKSEGDGKGPRPRTVHGKKELDMRGGRSASRKGPTPAHVRSQSVPVVPEANETPKSAPKFGTWGLGTKNVSEDWDDDFDFDEGGLELGSSSNGKKDEAAFPMVVPASIQATQPTVKAHSGQIRELSLLVNDLKRLCRLGREMEMTSGSAAALWREADGIIALASPDDDEPNVLDIDMTPPTEKDTERFGDGFIAQGFDGASLDDLDKNTPSPGSRAAGPNHSRRQSVFSPEDDIFGTWDRIDSPPKERPITPENSTRGGNSSLPNGMARSVMEAMHSRHTKMIAGTQAVGTAGSKLNFDTNSLKELVKQASDLRDALSEVVRRVDRITSSPARTPKRLRQDGSPAFTRVFDDPSSSPTRKTSTSHGNTAINGDAVSSSPSSGLNQRFQMMTVS